MVWWSPHETSLSRTASSLTAGAAPAGYSGPHSKRTLSTTRDRGLVGGQLTTALTGLRHGKKTHSTRLGCRTTTTLTNGSGKRRRDNLLATSDSSRCDIRGIHGFPVHTLSITKYGASSRFCLRLKQSLSSGVNNARLYSYY